jgi:hypothetical protein
VTKTINQDIMKKSRQVQRYELRKEAFGNMSKNYPGTPRKVRRSIALDLSKKWFKANRGVA